MKSNFLINYVTEFDISELHNAVDFLNAVPDTKCIDGIECKKVSKVLKCHPNKDDSYAVVVEYTNATE